MNCGVLLFLLFPISVSSTEISTVTDSFLWPNSLKKGHNPEVIQVSIVLPANYKFNRLGLEPAQERSGPGILQGFVEAEKRGLTKDILFNLTFRDSKCDNIYAPKSFIDGIVDGVDVFFGPSCDLSLIHI